MGGAAEQRPCLTLLPALPRLLTHLQLSPLHRQHHAHASVQVWENCPVGAGAAAREENAVVCCSMLGGLTASKCTCAVMGFAEPELLGFIAHWTTHCSSEPMWDSYRLACHHTGASPEGRGWAVPCTIRACSQVGDGCTQAAVGRWFVTISEGHGAGVVLFLNGFHMSSAPACGQGSLALLTITQAVGSFLFVSRIHFKNDIAEWV